MDVGKSENSSSVFIKVEVDDDFDYEEESPEPMEIRQQNEVKEVKDEIFDESSSSTSSESVDDYPFDNVQCSKCLVKFEDESCLRSHEVSCPVSNSNSSGGNSSEINKRPDIPSTSLFHDAIKKQLRQKVLDRMLKKKVVNAEEGDKQSTNEQTMDILTCVNATPFIIKSNPEKNDCTKTSKESKRAFQMKKLRLPSSAKRMKFWKNGFHYRLQELVEKKSLADHASVSSSSTVSPDSDTTTKGLINSNSTAVIGSSVNILKKRKPKRPPKVFKCDGCDRRFSKLQALYGHSAIHKRKDPKKQSKSIVRDSTICQVPSCKMTGIEDMEFHMRSHMKIKTGSFICPICDINEKEVDKLSDHMINNHGVTMPAVYSCPKCDQIFNTPGMRGIHMRKTHEQ